MKRSIHNLIAEFKETHNSVLKHTGDPDHAEAVFMALLVGAESALRSVQQFEKAFIINSFLRSHREFNAAYEEVRASDKAQSPHTLIVDSCPIVGK